MDSITIQREYSNYALLRMYMVYKAIKDGWNVSKISKNKFAFTKEFRHPKRYTLQQFMDKYTV